MKKTVIFSVAMTAFLWIGSSIVSAQTGYGRGFHDGPGTWMTDSCRILLMVDDLSKELSLTEEQKLEIEEIHYAHISEMKQLRNKYKNDCVGEREARFQLRDKLDKDVKAVLTKEQQEQFDSFLCERRGPHGKHHGHWR
ncbi:MAG: hypothetical protein JXB24_12940 [Bacteroidales bacterium]|nr:hypothetical protein [Bacteroidales bacterium]